MLTISKIELGAFTSRLQPLDLGSLLPPAAAVLSVADTGIGIPEEDQVSLFTRFFRASNAVEAAIPGSGLGLSIVRTIVANHHGELSIESGRDQGTTVTVRIPLQGSAQGDRAERDRVRRP